jgi:hypothetical protein
LAEREVDRLKTVALVDAADSALHLTPLGRQRYNAEPKKYAWLAPALPTLKVGPLLLPRRG